MSAYIVSDNHIQAILCFSRSKFITFYIGDLTLNSIDDTNTIGQILLDENYKSVNYKYKENDIPHIYNYNFKSDYNNHTPVEIIKLCHCLIYQSCETENYYDSVAYKIISIIEKHAIWALDGYEDAPWSLE